MTSADFDPFEVLGVRPGATEKQIRAAYKEQVALYHPDKHRGNPLESLAADKLRAINRAYEILIKGESPRPARGASPSAVSAHKPQPDAIARAMKTMGLVAGALFFLRFGFGLLRELLLVGRGAAMGLLYLVRLNPIFLIAVLLALGMLTSYILKARHRE